MHKNSNLKWFGSELQVGFQSILRQHPKQLGHGIFSNVRL